MSGNERNGTPWRAMAGILALAVLAFTLAVLMGVWEVRRPARAAPTQPPDAPTAPPGPECSIQRLKAAEFLVENSPIDGLGLHWVYKFKGGLPRCWVEVESEGKKQTVGQWSALAHPGFIGADVLDRPINESMEGYVGLFVLSPQEQTYRLVYGVTRVKYPENSKRRTQTTGFRTEVRFALPKPSLDAGGAAVPEDVGGQMDDGDALRTVPPGTDARLNSVDQKLPPGGARRTISLNLRFWTAEEIAAAGK
jgi:hypothetical protein